MGKLRTALFGAAMIACVAAPAAATPVGSLTLVGPIADSKQVFFDVMLPLHDVDKLQALVNAQTDPASAQYHKWLTPAQFGAKFGPTAAAKASVAEYMKSQGFNVVKIETRSIRVQGTSAQIAHTFGARLVMAKGTDGAQHIVTNDSFTMPSVLAASNAKIISFVPHAFHTMSYQVPGAVLKAKSRSAGKQSPKTIQGYQSNSTGTTSPDNRYSATGGYWFDDMKQAYQYPSFQDTVSVGGNTIPLTGTGATIGALMSSDVWDTDIQGMFDFENWQSVTGAPDPTLAGRFYVDGGAEWPNGATAEASLDTQMEIGGAPGANVVLIDIPDLSDGSVLAGLTDIDEYNFVDVVSMSFGQCEQDYLPKYNYGQSYMGVVVAEDELFLQGNAEGITWLASSGDEAGRECPSVSYFYGQPAHYVPSVSLPASDPNVTAVGGTNLVTNYNQDTLDSTYAGENAWDDPETPDDPYGFGVDVTHHVWGAGGGYSVIFGAPSYQSLVTTGSTMRAVPDIGMQVGGCPYGATDYHPHKNECYDNSANDGSGNTQRSFVWVAYGLDEGGEYAGLIGTSVSSPEFASVVAHMVETQGRMGNLNGYIYREAKKQANGVGKPAYHVNIPGYNDVVNTDVNSTYSLSVGVGTPIVSTFIGQPPHAAQAGTPQTPSNP